MIRAHVIIEYEGVQLAAIREATLSVQHDLVRKDGGDEWQSYTPGIIGWTVRAGILQKIVSGVRVASQQGLESYALARTPITLTVTTDYNEYEGEAIVTEMTIDAETNAAMSGSFSFQGISELVLTE